MHDKFFSLWYEIGTTNPEEAGIKINKLNFKLN